MKKHYRHEHDCLNCGTQLQGIKSKLNQTTLSEQQKKDIVNTAASPATEPATTIAFNNNDGIKIISSSRKDSTVEQYNASQQKLPAAKRDHFWDHFVKEKTLQYKQNYGDKAWDHFREDVEHNLPKMMFVLLPLFALILKLAFWKNHKYYVEHLIYAIHLHCFFFLFSALILIVEMVLPQSWQAVSGCLSVLLFIYTLYYVYRSLRTLYHRSRWRTISKMTSMAFMYSMVALFCLIGLLMATAATA